MLVVSFRLFNMILASVTCIQNTYRGCGRKPFTFAQLIGSANYFYFEP